MWKKVFRPLLKNFWLRHWMSDVGGPNHWVMVGNLLSGDGKVPSPITQGESSITHWGWWVIGGDLPTEWLWVIYPLGDGWVNFGCYHPFWVYLPYMGKGSDYPIIYGQGGDCPPPPFLLIGRKIVIPLLILNPKKHTRVPPYVFA